MGVEGGFFSGLAFFSKVYETCLGGMEELLGYYPGDWDYYAI